MDDDDDDDDDVRDEMVGGNIDHNVNGSNVDLLDIIRGLRNSHDNVELRIQLLEEITLRLREQRELAQSNFNVLERSDVSAVQNTGLEQNETDRGFKRKHSELVARALEDVSDVKKDDDDDDSDGGSFYDCNICLEMAKDPVLTCCGHLFCWACFYRLEYVDLTTKECPVCRGDVIDSQLTPIYGSVNGSHVADSESGVCIPPRPKAHRMENARQRARRMESARQRVNRSVTDVPVAQVLRRIRMAVGDITEQPRQQEQTNPIAEQPRRQAVNATEEQPVQQHTDSSNADSITELQPSWTNAGIDGSRHNESVTEQPRQPNLDITSPAISLTGERGARQRLHSHHLSRGLLETATSFALDNTERLVDNTLSNRVAVIQTELQSLNSIAEMNVSPPPDASAAAVAPLENPETASSSVSDHPSLSHSHSFTNSPSED